MKPDVWDCAVIGGGLAGCCLAWALKRRGLSSLLIDQSDRGSASRLAAGLIAPYSGKRLASVEGFDDDWLVAVDFYKRVEAHCRQNLLVIGPTVYSFISRQQADAWRLRSPLTLLGDPFLAPYGAAQTLLAGRLDVASFLDVTHAVWTRNDAMLRKTIDLTDIQPAHQWIAVGDGGICARRVVTCLGVAGVRWPETAQLPWTPARGELLTVRMPSIAETRVVRGGVWLAPLGGGLFRVGATYDRERLDCGPTPEGRAWLLHRLSELVDAPAEVIAHQSGVRPLMANRLPVSGWSATDPRIGWINGLGSHGALRAPRLALRMAEQVGAS